ncbi:unnamed protein product [Periconia digitata]|uniref:Uncharacterized protein n=1 Tax=Periconia digitata TaxID=1303443 RepID=A0A9W4U673_9PLEO|nr:unnamed protein product [Periconia digitata]
MLFLSYPTFATLFLAASTQATPFPQSKDPPKCQLDPFAPSSWAASGGEKLLRNWLDKNGPVNWLQELSKDVLGSNTNAIDCAHISSTSCSAPQGPAQCDKYSYHFVRTMAAQINSAFRSIHDNLENQVIKDSLKVDTIISEFDLLKPPKGSDTALTLKNIALGPTAMSALFGMIPGGGGAVAAGLLSLIGGTFGAVSDNLEEEETEIPEYQDLASVMNDRLGRFFGSTQQKLEKTLLAIFGALPENGSNDDLVREMVGRMSGLGVKGLNKDAKSPVSELLKGGHWLSPVYKSQVDTGIKKGFKNIQRGLIGNLLAAMHVYVEQELPAWNEGLVQPCTALGTLRDGNSCLVIKHRPWGGAKDGVDAKPLDEKYLQLMGDYGLKGDELHKMIKNVRDCNNGKTDNSQIITDGSYPACYFGMNFAKRVHPKDHDFHMSIFTAEYPCISYYRDQEGVPGWITDDRVHCHDEVPVWGPCTVKLEELSYWSESGLTRYRLGLVGEGVDMATICPYVHDGRKCMWGSNRQCYHNDKLDKMVLDINFAKGSAGHDSYQYCRKELTENFARNNRCEIV